MTSDALQTVKSLALVGERRSLILDLLPLDVSPPRFTRAIQAALMRSPKLRNAEPESLQSAVIDAAALGVVVGDSLGQGFLVVDRENKARLMLGYKFVAMAARRVGFRVSSSNVREGDEFSYALGDRPSVTHRPSLALPARRPVIAAWALAAPVDRQGDPLAVILSRAQLLEIRANAPAIKAGKSTPWRDIDAIPFGRMCEKSAVRRLLPSLPLGTDAARAVERVADADEENAGPTATRDFDQDDGELAADRSPARERAGGRGREATDVDAEVVEPAPRFPEFSRLAEFSTWSRDYLATATPAAVRAWSEHFGGRLDQATATGRPEVVEAVDALRRLAQRRAAGA